MADQSPTVSAPVLLQQPNNDQNQFSFNMGILLESVANIKSDIKDIKGTQGDIFSKVNEIKDAQNQMLIDQKSLEKDVKKNEDMHEELEKKVRGISTDVDAMKISNAKVLGAIALASALGAIAAVVCEILVKLYGGVR